LKPCALLHPARPFSLRLSQPAMQLRRRLAAHLHSRVYGGGPRARPGAVASRSEQPRLSVFSGVHVPGQREAWGVSTSGHRSRSVPEADFGHLGRPRLRVEQRRPARTRWVRYRVGVSSWRWVRICCFLACICEGCGKV